MKNQYAFRTNAVWARLNEDFNYFSHHQASEIPPHLAQFVEVLTDDQARAGLKELFKLYSFPTDAQFVEVMKWAAKQKPRLVVTPFPDDWRPSKTHEALTEKYDLSLIPEAAHFRNFSLAHGDECLDWDTAFSIWLYESFKSKKG